MWKSIATALCLLAIATGCATTRLTGEVEIQLINASSVSIGDKIVGIADVPGELKAMGAGPETAIHITVPRNMPHATLQQVLKPLASAGFRKLVFVTERHAEAEAKK